MFYYKTNSHKTMPSHEHNKTPSQDLHNIKLMTINIHHCFIQALAADLHGDLRILS